MPKNLTEPRCYSYIRFSTPEQEKGHSLQRQRDYIAQSEEIARKKGMVLDNSLRMEDRGLSAYKGDHIRKGKLGAFLKEVERGRVPKNSILIVESLDRLSREDVLTALGQFMDILRHSIAIITLGDNFEYSHKEVSANPMQLMYSIMQMATAHTESAKKAERLSKAWEGKRKTIRENPKAKPITSRAPEWLKYNGQKERFEPIADRVKVVKLIYRLCIDGYGIGRIVKYLNDKDIPTFRGKDGWQSSTVTRFLKTKAVIGEFQPYKRVDNKRVKDGEPIPGYFPAIIDEKTYFRAQDAKRSRRCRKGNAGGRVGQISNLFTHLAKCGYCHQPMHFVNKGEKKGGKYLVCSGAARNTGCKYISYRYEEFEKAFLIFCTAIDVQDVTASDTDLPSRIADIGGELSLKKNKLVETRSKINKTVASLGEDDSQEVQEVIKEKIQQYLDEQKKRENQVTALEAQLEKLIHANEDAAQSLTEMKDLIYTMQELEGEELIILRSKLRSEIRRRVRTILLYPGGPSNRAQIAHWKRILKEMDDCPAKFKWSIKKRIERLKKGLNYERDKQHFRVFLENETSFIVKPNVGNYGINRTLIEKVSKAEGIICIKPDLVGKKITIEAADLLNIKKQTVLKDVDRKAFYTTDQKSQESDWLWESNKRKSKNKSTSKAKGRRKKKTSKK